MEGVPVPVLEALGIADPVEDPVAVAVAVAVREAGEDGFVLGVLDGVLDGVGVKHWPSGKIHCVPTTEPP